MPITFTVNDEYGYFFSKYSGQLSLEDIVLAHEAFFKSGQWNPTLNALVDLYDADFTESSNQTIRKLAQYFESILHAHKANNLKSAIYAPQDFPYGLARVYEAMTALAPWSVRVFRDLQEAKAWLKDGKKKDIYCTCDDGKSL